MSALSAWIVAFADLRDDETSVRCPGCGCDQLGFCVDGDPGSVGFGAIWCRCCNRGTWISRLEVRPGDTKCSSTEVPDFENVTE